MQVGASLLTDYTGLLVRHAPCALCKGMNCGLWGAATVATWMVGEGAQYVRTRQQLMAIEDEIIGYCAAVGGCA